MLYVAVSYKSSHQQNFIELIFKKHFSNDSCMWSNCFVIRN